MNQAEIINGKKLADELKQKLKVHVDLLKQRYGIRPFLQTLLVGDNPASQIYVNNKLIQSQEIGIRAHCLSLPKETSEQDLLSHIRRYNEDSSVHGILVQLPLPFRFAKVNIFQTINPQKDVDGLHPFNAGLLMHGQEGFIPCTPLGCLYILRQYITHFAGKKVLIIGRSDIVGKPLAMLMLHQDCTVTLAHSHTQNLQKECGEADIIIAAAGEHHLIRGFWLKKGSIVLDVGINRLESGEIRGDVNLEEALKVSRYITPVPGGVGPLTIACLLYNTIKACCLQNQLPLPNIPALNLK
jgi:methylenetetrahydrofolate dehydrogenase (NADP+) / methenyltetrahydrofolate cyclohydrolase